MNALRKPPSLPQLLGDGSSVERLLVVIAHPDDETMFFAPTITRYDQ